MNDGVKVENHSIVNYFNTNGTLTLTCTSDKMFDIVEWIVINQTGTVERQYTNTFNISSTALFINSSDDFISYLRCDYSHHRSLHKDVFIAKGNDNIMFIAL